MGSQIIQCESIKSSVQPSSQNIYEQIASLRVNNPTMYGQSMHGGNSVQKSIEVTNTLSNLNLPQSNKATILKAGTHYSSHLNFEAESDQKSVIQQQSLLKRETYVGHDPILYESHLTNKERTLSVTPTEYNNDYSRLTHMNNASCLNPEASRPQMQLCVDQ